jgi:hypothetical protein
VFCDEGCRTLQREPHQVDTREIPGLRIRLRVSVLALAQLPGSCCFHPDAGSPRCHSGHPSPALDHLDQAPLQVEAPLREGPSSESERLRQLDAEREKQHVNFRISGALVAAELLERRRSLQQHLRQNDVHVLHFVGHGTWDFETETGSLVFEKPNGTGAEVDAETLATILCDHDPLRLVVLNACESAKSSPTNPYAGTATTLVRKGAPAVVAMQFDISDEAAVQFCKAFYRRSRTGIPRKERSPRPERRCLVRGNVVEWGTPVLFSRSQDGRLFDLKRGKAAAGEARPGDQAAGAEADRGAPAKRIANPASGELSDEEARVTRERDLENQLNEAMRTIGKMTLENRALQDLLNKKK